MECKRCGGEINTLNGRCTACGQPADDTASITIVRSIDELAEHYGLNVPEDNGELPELFSDYDSKLTRRARAMRDSADDSENEKTSGSPTMGLNDYARLLGVSPNEKIESRAAAAEAEESPDVQNEDFQSEEKPHEMPAFLQKIDRIIEKPANMVLDVYHSKYPRPARARQSEQTERLMLLAGVMGVAAFIVIITAVIIGSIAPDISGKWLIAETSAGEQLTIDFSRSHEVTVCVCIDSEENVYQTGTYEVRRSNGYNLLTITYDDGSEKRLYYTLEKDSGTFTNVDTNKSDTYARID